MPTHGENVEILEDLIRELQERLRTSDSKLKVALEGKLNLSEEKVRILEGKVREMERELDSCISRK